MPTTLADLINRAVAGHRRGERWSTFWPQVAKHVEVMADGDPEKRQRLAERLLAALASGELSGIEPPGSEPTAVPAATPGGCPWP
jgi:uncharacterized Ntn-hydrolase superfamily protein